MTMNMGYLIRYVDELQSRFASTGNDLVMDLPELVVIGHQTSGKSSVLESIVGKDFLPRGEGTVTRALIRLELNPVHSHDKGKSGTVDGKGKDDDDDENKVHVRGGPDEWVVFGHKPNQKFTDFRKVKDEIVNQMNVLAGPNGISSESVVVKIYSPRVLKLTLIDTPGFVQGIDAVHKQMKVAIEDTIRPLISRPNTIIVAIAVATEDLATSVGYAEATQVDPTGERTILVLTKLDNLANIGKDATALLTRQDPILLKKPRLQVVGVVNRSHQANESNMPFEKMKENEQSFFKKFYPSVIPRCGSQYLGTLLQEVLAKHIARDLPRLQAKLGNEISSYQSILNTLGEKKSFNEVEKDEMLTGLIKKFTDNLSSAIRGEPKALPLTQCHGGGNISKIFYDDLPEMLSLIDSTNNLTARQIDYMIQNTEGKPTIFTSNAVVEALVDIYLDQLSVPCLKVADLVRDALMEIVKECPRKLDGVETRFPNFVSAIIKETSGFIEENTEMTKKQIGEHIQKERSLKNFNHPDLSVYRTYYAVEVERRRAQSVNGVSTNSAPQNTPIFVCMNRKGFGWFDDMPNDPAVVHAALDNPEHRAIRKNDRDNAAIATLAYSEIITKNVLDYIPKTIYYQLIDQIKENLFQRLYKTLKRNVEAEGYFEEPVDIKERRANADETLKNLKEAADFLRTKVHFHENN